VTEANVNYEGSITIPQDLLEVSGLLPHESVHVWNVTRGTRFETYILEGERGSREFHVNGAAAHLVEKGDVLIVATFIFVPAATASLHQPNVVFLDEENRVKSTRREKPATIVA
jgi:aspartate 1-decarboxylase